MQPSLIYSNWHLQDILVPYAKLILMWQLFLCLSLTPSFKRSKATIYQSRHAYIISQTVKADNYEGFVLFSVGFASQSWLQKSFCKLLCAVQLRPTGSRCRVGEGRACWSLGNAYTALGNHDTALDFAQKHLEISKEVRIRTNSSAVFHFVPNFS